MSIIHVASPDEVRPRHVAMIVLVLLTLLGVCLITSGAKSIFLPDGATHWPAESPFRILVELFNLHYSQPTPSGFEVKPLVFGLGTALALLAVGITIALRPRGDDEMQDGDTIASEAGATDAADAALRSPGSKQLSPLLAAQVLMLLYVAWSFASIAWSEARDIALYGSIELAIYTVWSFALAYGLNRASFRFAAYALVAAGAATAAMAVGYTVERNPTLRASYPIGNPLFLAACLIPGLLIGLCGIVAQVRDYGNPRRIRRAASVACCLAALGMMAWAFWLTDSRGPNLALIGGCAAIVFLCSTGRVRWGVLILGALLAALAVYAVASRAERFSPTGRDVSLRERYYTWGYALDLIGQRKLLGHGQGGYTRKADALASGHDVLEDPEALTPRVAHAHNEWLEVWADLGSLGLVLVAGSLLFTVIAGMAALSTLPTLTMRFVLIALIASLVALIVEESASVGLRIAGLPTIFYTVIGLIWAAGMPDKPSVVRVLQKSGTRRGATFVATAAVALAVGHYSFADFHAARAEYEVAAAIENMRWQDAVRLAEQARTHRLSPHRRLVAQERLSETYLHVAHVHQINGLRRIQMAMASDPPDSQRLALGEQDAEAAESYRRQGMLVLGDLIRKAPNFYNSNYVEYELEQIRATFARARGDVEAARQFDQNSAVALQRELDRRPYDANMAGRLVLASGSTMSVEDICRVLARPLRFNPVPPVYFEIAARLLTVPALMEEFAPLYQQARAAPPDAPLPEDSLVPETLRLAAVFWFQEGEPLVAEQAIEAACTRYDALRPRYAYAAAACFAELADRRFFNQPTEPERALQDLEEAVKRAPRSHEGRQLVEAVKDSRVAMLLAKGDEAAARAALMELSARLDDAALRAALSARYASLAAALMQRDAARYLSTLRGWVVRAIELDPTSAMAWQQKADIAFRDEDDAECVRCLREARRWGATDDFIYRFVDIALSQRPASVPLLQFRDELAAEMAGGVPPAASAPTAAPPGN